MTTPQVPQPTPQTPSVSQPPLQTGQQPTQQGSPSPDRNNTTKYLITGIVVVAFLIVMSLGAVAIMLLTRETPSDDANVPSESPTQEPAGKDEIDKFFGDFSPVSFAGNGDQTVQLPSSVSASVVKLECSCNKVSLKAKEGSGYRDFVFALNQHGNINGKYLLAASVDETSGKRDTFSSISVDADGPWTMSLSPLNQAPQLGDSGLSANTPNVMLYSGPTKKFSFTTQSSGPSYMSQIGQDYSVRLSQPSSSTHETLLISGISAIEVDSYSEYTLSP